MSMNPRDNGSSRLEDALAYVEKMLEKCGAVPAYQIGTKNREFFGHRLTYLYRGLYYRVEAADFDGESFIVISATDRADFAKVGIEDNIAVFRYDLSKEKLEREVRFALELEPYPENYPDY